MSFNSYIDIPTECWMAVLEKVMSDCKGQSDPVWPSKHLELCLDNIWGL